MPTTNSHDSLAALRGQADSRRDPGYRKLRRRRLWLAGCAAGVAGLAAGAMPALALIRSAPVVFHGCVTNKTGAIRIVPASANCAAGQHKISWNQTGPRGLTGPKGPPGAAAGFETQVIVSKLLNASAETTVAHLKLPAGKFIVSAASLAGFSATAPAVDSVACNIISPQGGNAVASTQVNLNQDPGEAVGNADVALTTAFTTRGGTMIFECIDSADQASMSNTTLTAVQVSSLNVQS